MDELTPDRVKQAVLDAGLEVYRAQGSAVHVAERVRVHLMDSGVRVVADPPARVLFTVRTQRSDFPSHSDQQLFERVREAMAASAEARGFTEAEASTRTITDPVDQARVLDVWHELTYAKPTADVQSMIDDVRWALAQPKCI